MGSILAADFGSVTTRVLLFDLVDGDYRMVARRDTLTTMDAPHDDAALALRRLLRDMGTAMGRRFLDNLGQVITPEQDDRSGVDAFVVSASVGRPMRVVLVNLLPEASHQAALRALSGAYVNVVASVFLSELPTLEDQINAVLLARPDLVLFSGGVDEGPRSAMLQLAHGLKLALQIIERSARPIVLYAGNAELAGEVSALFEEQTHTLTAPNVLPEYHRPAPQAVAPVIAQAYRLYQERVGDGFDAISASSAGIVPTGQAYDLMARFLAAQRGDNVLIVDAGSASMLLYAVVDGQLYARLSSQHGVGHSAVSLYEAVGIEAIRAWLPFNARLRDVEHFAWNKSLLPASLPITLRETYLEHAFLRAGMRQLMHELSAQLPQPDRAPQFQTIIAAGSPLTRTGKPGYNLLLIADCVQPVGIAQVFADAHGALAALGSLARVDVLPVVQILESDNLERLGTLISLEGQPRQGRVAARMTLVTGGEKIHYDLNGGEVLFLPLPPGFELQLDLRCEGGMRLQGRRRVRVSLQGGTAGVMIDARGRALSAGQTVQERARRLPRWIQVATDDPPHDIPADWLEELPAEKPEPLRTPDRRRPAPGQPAVDDELAAALREEPAGSASRPAAQPASAAPFVDDDDLRRLL